MAGGGVDRSGGWHPPAAVRVAATIRNEESRAGF
jgi:hypothetical protein